MRESVLKPDTYIGRYVLDDIRLWQGCVLADMQDEIAKQ